ncbi:Response regulator/sensor histidine kinase HsfB [Fimbriiglobus ruber]|uniref:histidine kinase n=2 Tax=Fimbriiglobus ruber TaxID=1908690 RepID=A0A225DTC3_9BACT|nr:Response regulator/sensor histidine kinase HsfB [Fimbriiglobus ruber]
MLFGLSSYMNTMRITERKLDQMSVVIQILKHIHQIESTSGSQRGEINLEKSRVTDAVAHARRALADYREQVKKAAETGLVSEYGDEETKVAEDLEKGFNRLDDAIPEVTVGLQDGERLVDNPKIQAAYVDTKRCSDSLYQYLRDDVRRSFERSTANHRRSLYISGSGAALAVVLVLTLLYYFRVWVFSPIKAIQAGVQRVHTGIFDQPIRIHSQDELEELANEFNAMTVRLRDIYGDLANQVNDRTRQLVRSERMVSVGFLAAGVAHEINNPLASIAFCAEALERRLHGIIDRIPGEAEVINKYLKMMQDEAQRCKQITHKLLDFSRSGGRREQTDLTQLVRDVIEVAGVLPNARNKKISFHPEMVVGAAVSPPDLKSVVLNLVVNALDSMDDGGTLSVALTARGEFAEMTFTDTGCGMTRETLENIFEPFFTRNRTGNGTGLGLSISHQIIDQHGGTITADSGGPGRGSTFTVRLPLRSASPAGDGRPADRGDRILAFPGTRTAAA